MLTPPAAPSPVGLSTSPVFRHFAALSTTGEVVDPAQDALDSATSPGESIAKAMVVPSTGKENDYSWLSRFPKMREWIGDKVVKALAAFNYTIRNKDWEATVEVERNDIEDDQIMNALRRVEE